MASDKRLGRKVPEWVRREDSAGVRIDSGPFIGAIKNNVDPTRSGRLQVWIPDLGGDENDQSNWRTVSYASPFTGTTYLPESSKNNKYTEVAHSYGMWAVPPDVGNQVICTFIAGDPGRGYWFACVNPNLSHTMVPALGTGKVDNTFTEDSGLKGKYSPDSVFPVAEFNENNQESIRPGFENNPKPIHEFQANILVNQGLDRDGMRGAISSSSQRETPSTVFGISTPGRPLNDPADDPGYVNKMKAGTLTDADTAVRARKGGHTFVMDDGDQMGKDQLLRLRTAGGHQILMNDTARVFYIANSDGSVWMEFTGGGHINVFSASGINMRTGGDFNVHASKDINFNSGGSVNFKVDGSFALQAKTTTIKSATSLGLQAGKIGILSDGELALQSTKGSFSSSGMLILKGDKILLNTDTPPSVKPVPDLKTFKQADTEWDSTAGLWINRADAFETVATITPGHEPWARGAGKGVPLAANTDSTRPSSTEQFQAAPQPESKTAVCTPTQPPQFGGRLIPTKVIPDWVKDTIFIDKAKSVAYLLKCDYLDLLTCMYYLSGDTMSPSKLDESGATGLLRFTTATAALLGTTCGYLATLSRAQQMDWVLNYYLQTSIVNLTSPSLSDLYVAVNWPIAIGTAGDYVVCRSGSKEYADNKGFDTNLDGIITKAEASAAVALRKDTVTSMVDYAGKPGMSTDSGLIIVDQSGNPVQPRAAGLDAGPADANGQPVQAPAPIECMDRQDAPSPSGIDSNDSKIPGFVASQVKALMVQIGFSESGLDYTKVNTSRNMIGRYQINAARLRDYGYIKPDYVSRYGPGSIFRNDAWTNKDSIGSSADWLSAPGVQESTMEQILNDYYLALTRGRGITIGDDVCVAAGMVAVAYFFREYEQGVTTGNPPNQAMYWRQQASQVDLVGTRAVVPYNQGRYAIDLLSASTYATTSTLSEGAVVGAEAVSDLASSVLVFTTGTGDLNHYRQIGVAMRTALEKMAAEFKAGTGRKLVISSSYRSYDEQTMIFNSWLAAGGSSENPSAGGYYMPSKPNLAGNPHSLRYAIDISKADAKELEGRGLLAKYGFTYPFPQKDPVHLQFRQG